MKKELTLRGLLIGLAGMVVITASSMYVALRMGALPWPTIFVTVVSMAALKKARGSSVQEINCTHTVMSAGAMVAGGLAFTIPGLWMIEKDARIPVSSLITLTLVGVVLGCLYTSLYRKKMVESLPYPMGKAACDTLQAGMSGGKEAGTVFGSLGAAAAYTALRDAAGVMPQAFCLWKGSAAATALYVYNSPMALGIGAIIGPVLAGVWLLGMVIGHYMIVPIGLATGAFADFSQADTFRADLGIGLMIGTGIGVLIMAFISLVKRLRSRSSSAGGKTAGMQKKEIRAVALILVFCVIILMLLCGLTPVQAILLVLLVGGATYLAAMLTGQTGVNPMEILGILVLLIIQLFSHPALVPAFTIAAVTAVAAGLAGDVMNDLKSGYLLGADPKQQIIGEAIGGVIGSFVAVAALLVLKAAYGSFGASSPLPAPQAAAVSAMVGGLPDPKAFAIGVAVGCVLYLLRVPTATLGLGVYLGTAISSVMGLGALIAFIAGKFWKNSAKNISLIASGALGGEGITGVVIAIIMMLHS